MYSSRGARRHALSSLATAFSIFLALFLLSPSRALAQANKCVDGVDIFGNPCGDNKPDRGSLGGACLPGKKCNGDLSCRGNVCKKKVIKKKKKGTEGGACYPNNTCNSGLSCESGKCVSKGSCRPGQDQYCCWPGQGWNGTICTGKPSCPNNLSPKGGDCVCRGGKTLTPDQLHCCWPEQGWSTTSKRCVGPPKCPAGTTRSGESCSGDRDKDGIPDSRDDCPTRAEDKDGFQDTDGCPDLDHDGDSVLDKKDKCPDEAEDLDGFEDSDGCPDLDNDKDGIPDTKDRCPNNPEDIDGLNDTDGCPEGDYDGDGIPDEKDRCPDKAEDKDGFQDTDGCPDLDNDRDGILDAKDKCPDDPEDKDGIEDSDGCPEQDADRDGVLDAKDKCPLDPEDKDGFEDGDGCPDRDNDQDGVPDSKDRCDGEKEDRDGYRDGDGCADPDNDGDRIPDGQDRCPDSAEDFDNFEDSDGCPDRDNDRDGISDYADRCPLKPETRDGVLDDDGCPDRWVLGSIAHLGDDSLFGAGVGVLGSRIIDAPTNITHTSVSLTRLHQGRWLETQMRLGYAWSDDPLNRVDALSTTLDSQDSTNQDSSDIAEVVSEKDRQLQALRTTLNYRQGPTAGMRIGLPLFSFPDPQRSFFSPINLAAGVDALAILSPLDQLRAPTVEGSFYLSNTLRLGRDFGLRLDYVRPFTEGAPDPYASAQIFWLKQRSSQQPVTTIGRDPTAMQFALLMGVSAETDGEDFAYHAPILFAPRLPHLDLGVGFEPSFGAVDNQRFVGLLSTMWYLPFAITGGALLLSLPATAQAPEVLLPVVGAMTGLSLGILNGNARLKIGAPIFSWGPLNLAAGGTVGGGIMAFRGGPDDTFKEGESKGRLDLGVYVANTIMLTQLLSLRVEYEHSFINTFAPGPKVSAFMQLRLGRQR